MLQLAAVACSIDPYTCIEDDQCRRDGDVGRCEAIGYCSYPDDDCASGSRFSPNAGRDRAGACVDEDASSDASGTTQGCETGPECPPAAEIAWERGWPDAEAVGLAVAGDLVAVIGNRTSGEIAPWAAAMTRTGDDGFGPVVLAERSGTAARGAVGLPEAIAIVGAGAGAGAGGERAWIAWLDLEGAIADEQVVDTLAAESFTAAARAGDDVAAVGRQGDDGWIRWFGSASIEAREPGVAFFGAAGRVDGVLGVVGQEGAGVVWRLVLPGGAALADGRLDVDELRAIAFAPDGGFVVGGRRADRPFVARFAADGDPGWTRDLADVGGVVTSLAVDRNTGDPVISVSASAGGALVQLDDAGERWRLELAWNGAPVRPAALASGTDGELFVSGTAETTNGSAAWLARVDR